MFSVFRRISREQNCVNQRVAGSDFKETGAQSLSSSEYSSGSGVHIIGQGAKATIKESFIDNHEGFGVKCDGCGIGTSIKNSYLRYNGLHGFQISNRSGITVESCQIDNNTYSGIQCVTASPTIKKCSMENNSSMGIDCTYNSNPPVSYSSVKNNQIGVVGSDNSHPMLGDYGFEAHNCIFVNELAVFDYEIAMDAFEAAVRNTFRDFCDAGFVQAFGRQRRSPPPVAD
ncbi:MAG: hypothetical protein GTO51_07450 [Candidatus Latescibacteria bacterium]|nr:hypothetical protein [Candidatus Latescibacterota bacterium]NIM65807.1 hypothetical protein [Candidatus Latescibacterota bacterium]NIO02299.1 hypothetical protein [Candidatus Latescibacterota bacterium]NIO29170.1 hypothetical protein [Candidatus Latescibacterota bacterium]NIO56785.1 hypothetical protein [Candidatus Latescibacterota bacterium]